MWHVHVHVRTDCASEMEILSASTPSVSRRRSMSYVASFMLLKGMMPAMVAGSPKYSALMPSFLPMLARHDTMLPRAAGIVSSAIRMRTCTLK